MNHYSTFSNFGGNLDFWNFSPKSFFSKVAQAGGGGGANLGYFWFLFIFSLNCSTLDHSTTAPSFPQKVFNIITHRSPEWHFCLRRVWLERSWTPWQGKLCSRDCSSCRRWNWKTRRWEKFAKNHLWRTAQRWWLQCHRHRMWRTDSLFVQGTYWRDMLVLEYTCSLESSPFPLEKRRQPYLIHPCQNDPRWNPQKAVDSMIWAFHYSNRDCNGSTLNAWP